MTNTIASEEINFAEKGARAETIIDPNDEMTIVQEAVKIGRIGNLEKMKFLLRDAYN